MKTVQLTIVSAALIFGALGCGSAVDDLLGAGELGLKAKSAGSQFNPAGKLSTFIVQIVSDDAVLSGVFVEFKIVDAPQPQVGTWTDQKAVEHAWHSRVPTLAEESKPLCGTLRSSGVTSDSQGEAAAKVQMADVACRPSALLVRATTGDAEAYNYLSVPPSSPVTH